MGPIVTPGAGLMRAAQVRRLDGPSGVDVVYLPEPVAGPGELVVDVDCAGISFPDLLLTRGLYQLKPELPFTIGIDFAGTIRHPSLDGRFAAGDRVAGFGAIGAAAQTVTAPPENLFPLPARVSFEQAAGLPLNYLTALLALTIRGNLRPGETVLVHGAAGGLGTAMIQVGKALGAQVIAVVSSDAKRTVAAAVRRRPCRRHRHVSDRRGRTDRGPGGRRGRRRGRP